MVEKYCKCGHYHKYSRWNGVKRKCVECNCIQFTNSKFPTRIDKVSFGAITGILGFCVFWCVIGLILFGVPLFEKNPVLEEEITVKLEVFVVILFCIFLIFALLLGSALHTEIINFIRKSKREQK